MARIKAKAAPPEQAAARYRILNAAYDLFSRRGVQSVGVDAVVAHSGVAKMTLYRHFPSKEDLALAFLEAREQRWTIEWLKAGVLKRSYNPHDRLLSIFDLYHEWFQAPDFEGCSFIRVMLESEPNSPLYKAAAQYLVNLGIFVADLAKDTRAIDPASLASAWHMLMRGSIIAAYGGNRNAALEAKRAAAILLKGWPMRAS